MASHIIHLFIIINLVHVSVLLVSALHGLLLHLGHEFLGVIPSSQLFILIILVLFSTLDLPLIIIVIGVTIVVLIGLVLEELADPLVLRRLLGLARLLELLG